jgi:DNA mismatch repair protein MutL
MSDIIRLLPDNVANQIAAGEVVQRPASVVKELLENSVDAKASQIKLVVEDAGKSKIQVIDNGSGLSENDARLAFERHATSKIEKAEDIFTIITKGFRGEALASIAAVAQVNLKAKTAQAELGTQLKIEGGTFKSQEFCNTPQGTRIEVEHLFYNLPARRNFLKSNNVELRHIIDEFERVALAHPRVSFEFIHNHTNLFDLPPTGLRQRIVNVFGKKFNEKLVPVEESTAILSLKGFVGKPEFAKKTRGEQFFFANHRYIKNGYLHKAVLNAFEGLLQDNSHPTYFLFLELDPAKIDVNIHPTKTEIKFEAEKAVFSIIHTAVKHALGQYNIAPSLDFEADTEFSNMPPPSGPISPPEVRVNPGFNPFKSSSQNTSPAFDSKGVVKGTPISGRGPQPPVSRQSQEWENLLSNLPEVEQSRQVEAPLEEQPSATAKQYLQIGKKYILTNHGNGIILIHQQRAHERILFERISSSIAGSNIPSQQLLFPQNLTFKAGDFALLRNLLPALIEFGFDIDEFGQNEVIVQGVPLYLEDAPLQSVFEQLLEDEKNFKNQDKSEQSKNMARAMAKVAALKTGTILETKMMATLVDELFACSNPYVALNGKAAVVNLNVNDIDKSFH